MKSIFATILLIGFAGAMVFGMFLMLRSMDNENYAECLPGIMDSVDCNSVINPLRYIEAHTQAFLGLIAASPATLSLFVSLFAVFVAIYFAFDFFLEVLLAASKAPINEPPVFSEKFIRWLRIHEKRDPALQFRL